MATPRKKSWREKLADDKDLPKVVRLTGANAKRWGGATLAIAAPREIDALMRTVPRGRVTTITELRSAIAKKHRAAAACPITTGIFSWMVAYAAEEASAAGEPEKSITPYWRTLKTGGELNPKYPGGVAALKRRLRVEGHAFTQKGARTFVRNVDRVLYSPEL